MKQHYTQSVFGDRNCEPNALLSLLFTRVLLGTHTGILSLFSGHTPAQVQHLRGPFEVRSPSEPLN